MVLAQTKQGSCIVKSGRDFYHFISIYVIGRHVVLLSRNSSTFLPTESKETASSLFLPLKADTFVNLQKYEQITVNDGNFFIADESGNYSRSVKGKMV